MFFLWFLRDIRRVDPGGLPSENVFGYLANVIPGFVDRIAEAFEQVLVCAPYDFVSNDVISVKRISTHEEDARRL